MSAGRRRGGNGGGNGRDGARSDSPQRLLIAFGRRDLDVKNGRQLCVGVVKEEGDGA